jgi:hypothetical protein
MILTDFTTEQGGIKVNHIIEIEKVSLVNLAISAAVIALFSTLLSQLVKRVI